MSITVTEAALQRISLLKRKRQTPDAFLRVGVRGGGCSGLSYYVDLVEATMEKDRVFTYGDNHKIIVDTKSYLFLNGTEIDFESTLLKKGFVFNNPMANRSCSCGESFTI